MKKTKIIITTVLAAAIAIGGISAIAEGSFMKNKQFEHKRPEITAEQREQMKEKAKERLDSALSEGKITEEQYNKILEGAENGKPGFGFGRHMGKGRMHRNMPERKAFTEEQKAKMKEKAKEMKEKVKEKLDSALSEGKITEEQYNKILEGAENGKPGFCFGRHMGKGRMHRNHGHRFDCNTIE